MEEGTRRGNGILGHYGSRILRCQAVPDLLVVNSEALFAEEFSGFADGIYAGWRTDAVDRYEVPKTTLCERGANPRQPIKNCYFINSWIATP